MSRSNYTTIRNIALVALIQLSFILANGEYQKLNKKFVGLEESLSKIEQSEKKEIDTCILFHTMDVKGTEKQMEEYENLLYSLDHMRAALLAKKEAKLEAELKTEEAKADKLMNTFIGKLKKEQVSACKKQGSGHVKSELNKILGETKKAEKDVKAFIKKNASNKGEVTHAHGLEAKIVKLLADVNKQIASKPMLFF